MLYIFNRLFVVLSVHGLDVMYRAQKLTGNCFLTTTYISSVRSFYLNATLIVVISTFLIFFIKNICSAWANYNFKHVNTNFQEEIIWNNSHIKINNRIVYYKFMHQKGITFVKDLFGDHLLPVSFEKSKT